MTDEELAAIKARWEHRRAARVVTVYGQAELFRQWVDHVADDETALLAEVERQREVVRGVADGDADYRDDDWPGAWVCSLCLGESETSSIHDREIKHDSDCLVMKARALLGSD